MSLFEQGECEGQITISCRTITLAPRRLRGDYRRDYWWGLVLIFLSLSAYVFFCSRTIRISSRIYYLMLWLEGIYLLIVHMFGLSNRANLADWYSYCDELYPSIRCSKHINFLSLHRRSTKRCLRRSSLKTFMSIDQEVFMSIDIRDRGVRTFFSLV